MKRLLGVLFTVVILAGFGAPMTTAMAASKEVDPLPEGFSGFEEALLTGWVYDFERQLSGVAVNCGFSLLGNPGMEKRIQGQTEYFLPSITHLTALQPTALSGELGAAVSGVGGLDLLLEDDAKYSYRFYQNGITFSKALAGKGASKPVAYQVDEKAYQTLLTALRGALGEDSAVYPLWLSNMRSSRASGIKLDIRGSRLSVSSYKEQFPALFDSMRWMNVQNQTPEMMKKARPPKTGNLVSIIFREGIVLTLEITDTTITVYSSDRDYALCYQYKGVSRLEELEHRTKGERIPPNTGKPVIYLYPERPTDVSVGLGFKGRLGETLPLYRDGWRVTAYPDGRLVDKTDGAQYPYLFWDGWTDTDWDFSEGFVVSGEQTESFLRGRLAEMGLTPKENQAFLDYWVPEMRANKYNLISFSSEQYQALAPLAISPSPDSLLRVHMVYRPLDAPIHVKPQSFTPFARTGFAVVEWGGTRAF